MHGIARIILLYTFLTFYACHSPENQHPEPIQKAITHFYTENENEEVLQQLELLNKSPLDDISKELVTIFRAGALCESGKIDSAAKIIQEIRPDKVQKSNLIWYHSILGLILFRQNEYTEAYKSLMTAINLKQFDDLRPVALNERLLARISFLLSDQDKGIEWLLLSTQHFKAVNLPKSEAVNNKILGRYYMNNGNFEDALSCFHSAEKIFKEYKDKSELFYININLVDYYLKTKDLKKAEYYALSCLNSCNDVTDNSMKTLVYNNLGEIELGRNKPDLSISYYKRTIETASDFPTANIRKTNAYLRLAQMYRNLGDYNNAEKNAMLAASLAPKTGQSLLKREIYLELVKSNLLLKKIDTALPLLDTARSLADSAYSAVSKSNRTFYDTKNQLMELSNEMEKMKMSEVKKRNTYIGIIIILIFLTAFIIIIYIQQQSKNIVLKALVRKNLQLLDDERKMNEMTITTPDPKKGPRKVTVNGKSEQLFEQLNNWLILNRNYARKEINLELVSKELGTNRDYLSKAINDHNIRFNDLVNKYRVEETIRIFADKSDIRNKYGLLVISSEVGFNSNSVFIDAFRKYSGMTPAQFRDSIETNEKT